MRFRLATGFIATCTLVFGGLPADVRADGISVYVGYADDLRSSPNFPSPWQGSPNTIFQGASSVDSGAVLVWNQTASNIIVNSMTVSGFTNGAVFNNGNVGWSTNITVPSGGFLVMTGYNDSGSFDTSDQLPNFSYYPDLTSGYTNTNRSSAQPVVALTINSVLNSLTDTGQILNTGGYDLASWPNTPGDFNAADANNESLQWRLIGTSDFTNPGGAPPGSAPEPASLTLLALGLVSLGTYGWRRRKLVPVAT